VAPRALRGRGAPTRTRSFRFRVPPSPRRREPRLPEPRRATATLIPRRTHDDRWACREAPSAVTLPRCVGACTRRDLTSSCRTAPSSIRSPSGVTRVIDLTLRCRPPLEVRELPTPRRDRGG